MYNTFHPKPHDAICTVVELLASSTSLTTFIQTATITCIRCFWAIRSIEASKASSHYHPSNLFNCPTPSTGHFSLCDLFDLDKPPFACWKYVSLLKSLPLTRASFRNSSKWHTLSSPFHSSIFVPCTRIKSYSYLWSLLLCSCHLPTITCPVLDSMVDWHSQVFV